MPKSTKVIENSDRYKSNDQFITAIRGLYLSMNFLGLWPQTSWKNWYNLIWYIQSIGLAFVLFGPAAGMIVKRHDPKIIVENLGLVIPMACICVKWLTFTVQSETIKTILCSLKEDWINLGRNHSVNRSVPDSKRIMTTYSRFAKNFFYIYVAQLMLAIGNFVRDSIAARNSRDNSTDLDKLLPLPNSWFPLDYNRSFNIQFLVVTQTITSTTLPLANASMDSLFITVTLHLCGQFKILRYFIESITYDSSKPECCNRKVRLMVKRHQVLLSVGERLQKAYNYLVLEQLIGSVLTMCFLAYRILEEMESESGSGSTLLESGFLCVASVQMIFAYCLVGDHLANQSIAVAAAVYNVRWYDCTRSINLSFEIVMIRARKPVEITGAKLLTMSLENFTVLMKAAASYLSVLRATGVGEV